MILAPNNYSTLHQHPLYIQLQQPFDGSIDHATPDIVDSDSIASSPQSSFSQYSTGLQSTPLPATLDISRASNNHLKNHTISGSAFRFPPASFADVGDNQNLSQVPDLMPSSESWLLHSHQQATPRNVHGLGHNRESSLSSLNSNGPASPYNTSISNPHIAVTDVNDGFQDLSTGGDSNYAYQLGKPSLSDSFYATLHSLPGHSAVPSDHSYTDGMSNLTAQHQKPRLDRNHLPSADPSISSVARSHPASVASSTVGGDSPATPSYQEPAEDDSRRRKNVFNTQGAGNSLSNHHQQMLPHHAAPPKLDRTMTDVYSDELYSPNFTITSASPPPQTQLSLSPSNELFSQVLKAANSQHLSAVHSPVASSPRISSPFRQGSPLAPSMHDFSQQGNAVRLSSAQQLREKQKLERDAKVLQQHLARNAASQQQQQGTPSTISPKDAMLDFNEPDDASNFPLFPPQDNSTSSDGNFGLNQVNKVMPHPVHNNFQARTPLQTAFDFSMASNIQIPQQYPFIPRPGQQPQPQPKQQEATPPVSTFPSRVSSTETTGSNVSVAPISRPANTSAEGGTYTCTYHGCTLRFETPALLQKHKREGHRQVTALSNARTGLTTSPGIPDTLLGSQAGPHRCDRINPSTGKSCNTVFSRPYDLTRHEDTIHNARKRKVRCDLCTEEKTFSRADALTRHYRVCHPDVEFPGKHRRRGGIAA